MYVRQRVRVWGVQGLGFNGLALGLGMFRIYWYIRGHAGFRA